MILKKLVGITLMLSFFITVGKGQNSAKAILENVSTNLRTMKGGATANFVYTTMDRNNKNLGTIHGSIALKGNKYFIKQAETEIYCNGVKTWNFNGTDEVNVAPVDNSSSTLNPQKILAGNFVDKDFSYKLLSKSGGYDLIELKPVDPRKNFTKANVYVSSSKKLITKAVIWEKAGNKVSFEMTNVNTHANLPDSKFEFDVKKHPGVDVIN